MHRREFIKGAAAGSLALALGGAGFGSEGRIAKERPNVVFIMTDQQRADMMSCTGNKWVRTPALDRLAASGVRFDRAYACNPVCAPSRFSLQTGRMPSEIGMGKNEDDKTAVVTDTMMEHCLGNLFQGAGYETVYGGKIHLPVRMNKVEDMGYRLLTRDRRQGLADSCAEFIRGPHEKPFLLFASFINPHDICYMAINAYRRSKGQPPMNNEDSNVCEGLLAPVREAGDIEAFVEKNAPPLPANFEIPQGEPGCIMEKYVPENSFLRYVRENWTETDWRLHRWLYARLTEKVDGEIMTVLDAISDAGLDHNTLVIFTSDHGDMDSAHRLEHKAYFYEESVGIPFIMSCPGVIPKGRVDSTHFVSNGLDLLPTVCDYAGIAIPEDLHGRSLQRLAEGRDPGRWRSFVVAESKAGRMLRTERFKYGIYDSGENREFLFDMEKDPGEMKNAAGEAEYRKTLEKHRKLLREWVEKTDDKIAEGYIGVGE